MDEQVDTFFTETTIAFAFLEREYGYQRLEGYIKYPEEWRDKTVLSRYVGSHVGVQITWSVADAIIDVIFIEVLQPGSFPQKISLFPLPNTARAISLFNLAEMRGVLNDPDFLLASKNKSLSWKKRTRLIETSRKEIILGLARATQTYASTILQGDTSMFTEVMEYFLAQQKRQNPHSWVSDLKQQASHLSTNKVNRRRNEER